jgi:hypothetical protein
MVSGLLYFFLEDRQAAKNNMWALRHILALTLYARDFLRIPSAACQVFSQHALQSGLIELLSKSQQLSTYLLSSSVEDGWHLKVCQAMMMGSSQDISDNIGKFVIDLFSRSKSCDSVREARMWRIVLQHILGDATMDEADQWLLLARNVEKTGMPFPFI